MKELIKKVGQMLCMGFEGQECGPELRSLLKEVQPGGIIFFQRNIATEEQFRRLVSDIRDVLKDSRPFLAIDQEGGQVDRFHELLGALPSAREAAQAGLSFELGDLAGRELAAFGLNVDFAPVLDLGSPESRSILGTRTAGDTSHEVIRFALDFLRGLSGWNIIACGKHFPGLGAGKKDSHIGMPVIEKSEQELWGTDLRPYIPTIIRYPMIMVAHAWYPPLERALAPNAASADRPLPASLSPNIIQNLLRRQIGHMGLVVSDDLEMGGVLEGRTIEEAAVDAVGAGCEVLLVCRHADHVQRMNAALRRELEDDLGFREQVSQAAERIRFEKEKEAFKQDEWGGRFADLEKLRSDISLFGEDIRKRSTERVSGPAEGLGDR
ncbi:MAG: glycoside hydrolase family 3 protein [Acidobacteria bacterium]|nr:glycoside hydrolase family 3 protein [Acidobacteriota bacterium]